MFSCCFQVSQWERIHSFNFVVEVTFSSKKNINLRVWWLNNTLLLLTSIYWTSRCLQLALTDKVIDHKHFVQIGSICNQFSFFSSLRCSRMSRTLLIPQTNAGKRGKYRNIYSKLKNDDFYTAPVWRTMLMGYLFWFHRHQNL